MDIIFSCSGCGQRIEIEETGEGMSVECPTCRQTLTVPPPSGRSHLVKNERTLKAAITKAAGDLQKSLKFDLKDLDEGLEFSLERTANEVAGGAMHYLNQNLTPETIEEFPALELHRVFDREVPRGSEADPKGKENGWGHRWQAACLKAGDEKAAACFAKTKRMVAKKSSGVWQALGEGAGGYSDCLGNPFPPFAVNSGMYTDDVSAKDTIALGLMKEGDTVRPAKNLTHEEIVQKFIEKISQYLTEMEGAKWSKRGEAWHF
jgi:hypothetical protein